jgi:hypothetical protein
MTNKKKRILLFQYRKRRIKNINKEEKKCRKVTLKEPSKKVSTISTTFQELNQSNLCVCDAQI